MLGSREKKRGLLIRYIDPDSTRCWGTVWMGMVQNELFELRELEEDVSHRAYFLDNLGQTATTIDERVCTGGVLVCCFRKP